MTHPSPQKVRVEAARREDGWWLIDPNNEHEWREVGPYDTKADAREAAHGLNEFWRCHPDLLTHGE